MWGFERNISNSLFLVIPKKSVQQARVAEVQGAIVDGVEGLAYPKPEKVLKYCQLACQLLHRGRCTQRQAQVVGGGFVYLAMFRRPLLGSLNALWKFIVSFDGLPPVVQQGIPLNVKEELSRFIGLSPLAVVNFRSSLSPCVTASDASEYGGGVTFSRGLTEAGGFAAQCHIRGDLVEPLEVESVLTIGLFDGISALRVAVDCLGWNILGHVSVESDPSCRRVVESRFPTTSFVNDVQLVDEEMVRTWACSYSQTTLVLIGSGAPCQGVSGLNSRRKGALRDERSCLFQHVPRIRQLVRNAFPWARVASFSENVYSMDAQDRAIMTEAFEETPWLVDAQDVSLARRPRLYWFDWELVTQEGVTLEHSREQGNEAFHRARLQALVDERKYLEPGWEKNGRDALPTFTTSRCRHYEGHRPAGKDQCSPHELQRWAADAFRYPPYQYRDSNCLVNAKGDIRVPSIQERECIMGFPKDYTLQAMKKALHGSQDHLSTRLTMIGNSWNVTVVAWLLNHLGYLLGFHPLRNAPGYGGAYCSRVLFGAPNLPPAATYGTSSQKRVRSRGSPLGPKADYPGQPKGRGFTVAGRLRGFGKVPQATSQCTCEALEMGGCCSLAVARSKRAHQCVRDARSPERHSVAFRTAGADQNKVCPHG